jgi:hypothetical protein
MHNETKLTQASATSPALSICPPGCYSSAEYHLFPKTCWLQQRSVSNSRTISSIVLTFLMFTIILSLNHILSPLPSCHPLPPSSFSQPSWCWWACCPPPIPLTHCLTLNSSTTKSCILSIAPTSPSLGPAPYCQIKNQTLNVLSGTPIREPVEDDSVVKFSSMSSA